MKQDTSSRVLCSLRHTTGWPTVLLLSLAFAGACGAPNPRERGTATTGRSGVSSADSTPAAPTAGGSSAHASEAPAASLPRRDLSLDENRGGHTIARHVGRSDEDLRQRLRRERIAAASTYVDLMVAERVVGAALEQAAQTIQAWERRRGSRPNLAVRYRGDPADPVGRSMLRGRREPVACYDALVVLRWDDRSRDYFVLTSYPEARR